MTVAAYGETVTIAALGDSLTQGYGLPAEDGLVPRLETWLKDQGEDVKLINAGVSGDTTAGGLARIDWTLTPDVDALIVALGGNDLLRGIAPEESRANLSALLKVAQSANIPVLLVGLEAPSNFGGDYKTSFDAIYPELSQEFKTLLYPSFLSALTESRDRAEVLKSLMQQDGLHPNAEGVDIIVPAIGPSVAKLIEQVDQETNKEAE